MAQLRAEISELRALLEDPSKREKEKMEEEEREKEREREEKREERERERRAATIAAIKEEYFKELQPLGWTERDVRWSTDTEDSLSLSHLHLRYYTEKEREKIEREREEEGRMIPNASLSLSLEFYRRVDAWAANQDLDLLSEGEYDRDGLYDLPVPSNDVISKLKKMKEREREREEVKAMKEKRNGRERERDENTPRNEREKEREREMIPHSQYYSQNVEKVRERERARESDRYNQTDCLVSFDDDEVPSLSHSLRVVPRRPFNLTSSSLSLSLSPSHQLSHSLPYDSTFVEIDTHPSLDSEVDIDLDGLCLPERRVGRVLAGDLSDGEIV